MAAKVYTAEELIALVRRIGAFPDVDSEGKEDSDILDVLDLALIDEIMPSIMAFDEEYFVRTVSVPIVSGIEDYLIPDRAMGNALRDLWWESVDGGQREEVEKIVREQRHLYNKTASQTPTGFYPEGSRIIMLPAVVAGVLKMAYLIRPGDLVKAADYRKVLTVDSTTAITLDSAIPTGWSSATIFDIHAAKSGAEIKVYSAVATTVAGSGITFSAKIDGTVDDTQPVVVGDYVVVEETAAVPAIPRDAHSALAYAAAIKLMESDGDSEHLKTTREALARLLKNFETLFGTRVDGKPHKLFNPSSFNRMQRNAWR